MWKSIFKGAFYVLFVLCLLAVCAATVFCVVYGVQQSDYLYYLYAAGVLAGGILAVLVLFSAMGMIIEMADNIEAIKYETCDRKSGKNKVVYAAPKQEQPQRSQEAQAPRAGYAYPVPYAPVYQNPYGYPYGYQNPYAAPYPQQVPVQPSVQYVPHAQPQPAPAAPVQPQPVNPAPEAPTAVPEESMDPSNWA
ncbi:MAG: hypothetical protein J6Z23_05385 [Lachnospiraceae bacterium]|nr:hypothetical protein [Lachnospiraceae bacterium]MBP5254798.1 hypothetical protein [Lachnospiraceae bacterium]